MPIVIYLSKNYSSFNASTCTRVIVENNHSIFRSFFITSYQYFPNMYDSKKFERYLISSLIEYVLSLVEKKSNLTNIFCKKQTFVLN